MRLLVLSNNARKAKAASSSTSSSSTTTKPKTTTSSTSTSSNTCKCETRVATLETLLTSIQSRLASIEQSPVSSVADNVIRVFPKALPYDERGALTSDNNEMSQLAEYILMQEYGDDVLSHLYLFGENGTKIKGSKFEKYFTIKSGKIEIDNLIMQESELGNHSSSEDYMLPLYTDIDIEYGQIVFSLLGGKKHTEISSIRFDINISKSMTEIKMTFPENVTILNNQIPAQNISVKQGQVITFTHVKELADNNLDGEYSFTLVAQGATKKYEIVFYWDKSYIPEFV